MTMAQDGDDGGSVPTLQEFLAALPEQDREALELNPDDLQTEFTRWSATFAWIATRLADEEGRLTRAQLATKRAKAIVAKDLASQKPKPSDELIKQLVVLEPDVQTAEEREIEAQRAYSRMKGLVEAMRGKKDMVVQMGARTRAEMDREPSLRDSETRNK